MWCVVHNESVSVNLVETFVVLKDNFEGGVIEEKNFGFHGKYMAGECRVGW